GGQGEGVPFVDHDGGTVVDGDAQGEGEDDDDEQREQSALSLAEGRGPGRGETPGQSSGHARSLPGIVHSKRTRAWSAKGSSGTASASTRRDRSSVGSSAGTSKTSWGWTRLSVARAGVGLGSVVGRSVGRRPSRRPSNSEVVCHP